MGQSSSTYSPPPSPPPSPTYSISPPPSPTYSISPLPSPTYSPPASPTYSPSPSPSPTYSPTPSTTYSPSPSPPPSYNVVKRPITAKSMKPMNMDGRRALERAVREMKECRDVFASWRRSIDSSTSSRPSDLERQIRSYIDRLEGNALDALRESEGIVRAHTTLGVLMSRRLSKTSSSGSVTLHPSREVISTIEEIQRRSEAVSEHADGMKDLLRGLVELLERGVPRRKKSLSQKLCGWLRKIFRVVAGVLSALSAASLAVFHIAAPALVAGSALASAAASLAGDLENGSPAKFEKLLALLRETIPAQAGMVAQKLSDFQYCYLILQHEMEMQRGVVYELDSREADHARLQWATHNTGMQLIRT